MRSMNAEEPEASRKEAERRSRWSVLSSGVIGKGIGRAVFLSSPSSSLRLCFPFRRINGLSFQRLYLELSSIFFCFFLKQCPDCNLFTTGLWKHLNWSVPPPPPFHGIESARLCVKCRLIFDAFAPPFRICPGCNDSLRPPPSGQHCQFVSGIRKILLIIARDSFLFFFYLCAYI